MKFTTFQDIFSEPRINRYLMATNGHKRRAKTLYKYNLKLSQEMFMVISCLEIALRNAIDKHYTEEYGHNWLKNFISPNGKFDDEKIRKTKEIIEKAEKDLGRKYTHHRHIARLEFGVWTYLFDKNQYRAGGLTLIKIFPKKSIGKEYNQSYIHSKLSEINKFRNRIAHHEPICFADNTNLIDTQSIRRIYTQIMIFFRWLGIDGKSLWNTLDIGKVNKICREIEKLRYTP